MGRESHGHRGWPTLPRDVADGSKRRWHLSSFSKDQRRSLDREKEESIPERRGSLCKGGEHSKCSGVEAAWKENWGGGWRSWAIRFRMLVLKMGSKGSCGCHWEDRDWSRLRGQKTWWDRLSVQGLCLHPNPLPQGRATSMFCVTFHITFPLGEKRSQSIPNIAGDKDDCRCVIEKDNSSISYKVEGKT